MNRVLHPEADGILADLNAAARTADAPMLPYPAVRRRGSIDLIAIDELIYALGADRHSELVRFVGRRDLWDLTGGRIASASSATRSSPPSSPPSAVSAWS